MSEPMRHRRARAEMPAAGAEDGAAHARLSSRATLPRPRHRPDGGDRPAALLQRERPPAARQRRGRRTCCASRSRRAKRPRLLRHARRAGRALPAAAPIASAGARTATAPRRRREGVHDRLRPPYRDRGGAAAGGRRSRGSPILRPGSIAATTDRRPEIDGQDRQMRRLPRPPAISAAVLVRLGGSGGALRPQT